MSFSYKPGDSVTSEFVTQVFSTGVATNADSLPTGTINRNGTDDGAVTVTVTNIDTGRYKAVFTIPSTYVPGDDVILSIAATVSSVAGKAIIFKTRVGLGVIRASTAQAGAAGSITLDASASATDSFYKWSWITLTSGTGAGQTRLCTAYVGSTKVATTVPNWTTNPDSTSVFAILPAAGVDVEAWLATVVPTPATAGIPDINAKNINNVATTSVTTVNANIGTTQPTNYTGSGASALVNAVTPIRSGTAQAGGASTITLDAGASATNNLYQNELVWITGGTGVGQVNTITSYVGSTKVATMTGSWATAPDNTSTFTILPAGPSSATVSGNVTVGGYAGGQDPATLLVASSTYLNAVSDNLLKRDLTALSGEPAYCLLNAIRSLRNVWLVDGSGVYHVKKEDGSTDAWTRTVTQTVGAVPVTAVT